jgi:hypothetical protein
LICTEFGKIICAGEHCRTGLLAAWIWYCGSYICFCSFFFSLSLDGKSYKIRTMHELIEDSFIKQALLQGGRLCYSCTRRKVDKSMLSFSMHQERDLLISVISTPAFTRSSTFFWQFKENNVPICHSSRLLLVSTTSNQISVQFESGADLC